MIDNKQYISCITFPNNCKLLQFENDLNVSQMDKNNAYFIIVNFSIFSTQLAYYCTENLSTLR